MKLVTAADPHYFFSYAPALVASCLQHQVPLHIEVVEPTASCLDLVEKMIPLKERGITFSLKVPPNGTYARLGTYCACRRFAVAASQLKVHDRVLVIDIDSFVRRPIPDFDAYDLGLWLRPKEPEPGMQCLAGCSMFTKSTSGLAEIIFRNCEREGFSTYFIDQSSIWSVFKQSAYAYVPEVASYFIDFSKWSDVGPYGTLIDWDFRDTSFIWTGKGLRKFTNSLYITEQNRLTAEFMDLIRSGFSNVIEHKSPYLLATT